MTPAHNCTDKQCPMFDTDLATKLVSSIAGLTATVEAQSENIKELREDMKILQQRKFPCVEQDNQIREIKEKLKWYDRGVIGALVAALWWFFVEYIARKGH